MELTLRNNYKNTKNLKLSWSLIVICFLLALLVLLSLISCERDTPKKTNFMSSRLTVLYFNDFHGHLLPFKRFYGDTELSGGFARMAYLVNKIREENIADGVDTLLFSLGDNFQGTPLSTAFSGQVEIEAFNILGLDASGIGNHDFDYGFNTLIKREELAEFPMLSANIYEINSSDLVFQPYVKIKTKLGLNIGVIGLSTPETPITTHPYNVSSLRFTPAGLAMQLYANKIDKESDVFFVLSHLGVRDDKEIAKYYPNVDVVFGGHTHTILSDPLYIGETMICQAGDRGIYLGRLDLRVIDDKVTMISNKLLTIGKHIPEHQEIKKLINSYYRKLKLEINRVVGTSDTFLDGERSHVRAGETNLGDFIADLMRIRSDSDIALVNSGAIRASVDAGEVTLGEIMRAFPMNNQLVTMDITGRELYLLLSRSVKILANNTAGNFSGASLQASGLSFKIKGDKVLELQVRGKPLRLYKVYKIATIDFLAVGGDGYREFKLGKNKYNTGVSLQDLFVNYMKMNGSVRTIKDNRMIRIK